MRRLIAFSCADETLVGSLDEAAATTGLLIVSGGNEVRVGAHRGMALLAAEIAAAGFPVFRYDRRGVGDSTGTNQGFLSAEPDLRAAVGQFRSAMPQLERIVGFGNCDAASTLALFGRGAGIDRVLLANPWVVEERDDLPPAPAIAAHYRRRLRSPAAWWRLIRGGINLRNAYRGLAKIVADRSQPTGTLARRVSDAIAGWGEDAGIILAEHDATAIAYRAIDRDRAATIVATDSHSFARRADKLAIRAAVLAILRS